MAKAGITTILNSRTSVLAAANPIYGRYTDNKNIGINYKFIKMIKLIYKQQFYQDLIVYSLLEIQELKLTIC